MVITTGPMDITTGQQLAVAITTSRQLGETSAWAPTLPDGPEENVPWAHTAEKADATVTTVNFAFLTAPAGRESATMAIASIIKSKISVLKLKGTKTNSFPP